MDISICICTYVMYTGGRWMLLCTTVGTHSCACTMLALIYVPFEYVLVSSLQFRVKARRRYTRSDTTRRHGNVAMMCRVKYPLICKCDVRQSLRYNLLGRTESISGVCVVYCMLFCVVAHRSCWQRVEWDFR